MDVLGGKELNLPETWHTPEPHCTFPSGAGTWRVSQSPPSSPVHWWGEGSPGCDCTSPRQRDIASYDTESLLCISTTCDPQSHVHPQ